MAGRSRRTKFFAQRQQLPWPAPATALVACILFPCTVALRALQACVSSGLIATPLAPVTFPWIAWPVLMMGALWFRHLEGAWFSSAAVTGRAMAAAALLGVLDGCSSSLDFFVTTGCGNTATRQGVMLAVLRASDIPMAAGLAAAAMAFKGQMPYISTTCNAMLFALPVAMGLAAASILACIGDEVPQRQDHLLYAAVLVAALCRAIRCAAGARLLRSAGVENSVGGLFFVGGFSGFFGSMLVLPMTLGLKSDPGVPLDVGLLASAVLLLGTADTISRLAVLRHSDAVTAASLDQGLIPMASLMAHSTTGLAVHEGLPTEFMALVVLLFSFLVQHQLASSREAEPGQVAPVLLGRASVDTLSRKKLRDV